MRVVPAAVADARRPCERYATSFWSAIGSASMSARSAITGPSPVPMSQTDAGAGRQHARAPGPSPRSVSTIDRGGAVLGEGQLGVGVQVPRRGDDVEGLTAPRPSRDLGEQRVDDRHELAAVRGSDRRWRW